MTKHQQSLCSCLFVVLFFALLHNQTLLSSLNGNAAQLRCQYECLHVQVALGDQETQGNGNSKKQMEKPNRTVKWKNFQEGSLPMSFGTLLS